jgi:hypothetical protein
MFAFVSTILSIVLLIVVIVEFKKLYDEIFKQ